MSVKELSNPHTEKEALGEALEYARRRGEESAINDGFGRFSGSKFESVIADYAKEKFETSPDEIPKNLFETLLREFENSYIRTTENLVVDESDFGSD
ncbi:MAG: hypothetical protein QXZ38_02050 [Candidatus Micrarchaeaceae archaeon]